MVWERMEKYLIRRKMSIAQVSGGLVRSRPRLGAMDGVTVTLDSWRKMVDAVRQCAKLVKEWRAMVLI